MNGSKRQAKHNQCDICFKQFDTALGFHHHYPSCLDKKFEG